MSTGGTKRRPLGCHQPPAGAAGASLLHPKTRLNFNRGDQGTGIRLHHPRWSQAASPLTFLALPNLTFPKTETLFLIPMPNLPRGCCPPHPSLAVQLLQTAESSRGLVQQLRHRRTATLPRLPAPRRADGRPKSPHLKAMTPLGAQGFEERSYVAVTHMRTVPTPHGWLVPPHWPLFLRNNRNH